VNTRISLQNRTALVTGAARGIGAACAQALARAGAEVAVNDLAASAESDALVASIAAEGGKAWFLPFNVADSAAVKAGIAEAAARMGRLDILVNNAGIRQDGIAMSMSDEQWRMVLEANLDGVFFCCRAALGLMRKQGGSIVNISSVAAFAGSAGQANYSAAKAGVVGLTRSLALEYGGRGIRVNCVAPGIIATSMTEGLKPEFKDELARRIALGRFGLPEEVAQAVLFLASDMASYISGATIHVNGGGYPA